MLSPAAWAKRPTTLLKALPLLLITVYVAVYYQYIPKWLGYQVSFHVLGHDITPPNVPYANATLGFSSIVAVSTENITAPTAWRQQGLADAANMTGLHIDVHNAQQSDILLSWYAGLPVEAKDQRIGIGFALSSKAHIDTLNSIIESGQESVLILEDDADWDVRIREQLSPQGGISLLLRSFDNTPDSMATERPYGLDWDVLFFGHCGHESGKGTKQQASFKDPTVPDHSWVRSHWNSRHYGAFLPQQRLVMQGGTALCTFGYGVTQKGARRIIELYDWKEPFDGMLLHECKKGNIRCNLVAPEVIHHQRTLEAVGPLTRFNGGLDTRKPEHFFTFNLEYSARCNAHRDQDDHGQSHEKWIKCPPTREQFLQNAS